MKKIAYCLFLLFTNAYWFLDAQIYEPPIPLDKTKIVDSDGKSPS